MGRVGVSGLGGSVLGAVLLRLGDTTRWKRLRRVLDSPSGTSSDSEFEFTESSRNRPRQSGDFVDDGARRWNKEPARGLAGGFPVSELSGHDVRGAVSLD